MMPFEKFCFFNPGFKKLLIIGHPRCGSGYAAKICKNLGLDVGHEKMGADGISSWMFAVDAWEYPFGIDMASSNKYVKFDNVVQHIRNPFDAIPSIVVENRVSRSFAFRDRYVRKFFDVSMVDYYSEIDRAALSFLAWHFICQEKRPDIIFRIEDQGDVLRRYLYETFGAEGFLGSEEPVNTAAQHYKGGIRRLDDSHLKKVDLKIFIKPDIKSEAWRRMDSHLFDKLCSFCHSYGYDVPKFF